MISLEKSVRGVKILIAIRFENNVVGRVDQLRRVGRNASVGAAGGFDLGTLQPRSRPN